MSQQIIVDLRGNQQSWKNNKDQTTEREPTVEFKPKKIMKNKSSRTRSLSATRKSSNRSLSNPSLNIIVKPNFIPEIYRKQFVTPLRGGIINEPIW